MCAIKPPAVESPPRVTYTPAVPVPIRLILVLLFAALLGILVLSAIMGYLLLRPPRMSDGKAIWLLKRLTPNDLDLPFEPMEFRVTDERNQSPLKLAAWWIPHPHAQGRCAILLHGYADAKVGAIAWAPVFHALAHNILVLDLRAHGESDGRITTAGFYEQHDLDQVINQLRARRPGETRHLTLFGASTGAAVAAATAARRNDLTAVILDSPFADFRRAAMAHFDLLGLPGAPVQRLALRLAEWMSGANFATVSPAATIPNIPCPVMLIHCETDPFSGEDDQDLLRTAIDARANPADAYWRVDGCAHLMAACADPDLYRQRIADFLSTATPVTAGTRSQDDQQVRVDGEGSRAGEPPEPPLSRYSGRGSG